MSSTRRARGFLRATIATALAAALTLTGVGVASAAMTEAPDVASASISGTVTDSMTTAAVPGASIVALDASGAQAGTATTGSAGGYTVSGLPVGVYRVSVSAAPDYDPVFWPAAVSFAAAQTVELTAGEARVGVDAALRPLQSSQTIEQESTPSSEALTDPVDSVEPTVNAEPLESDAPVAAGAAAAETTATASLSTSPPTTGEPDGSISGTITRQSDATPVEGVDIFLTSTDGKHFGSGVSNADGTYMIPTVGAGEYRVQFSPTASSGLSSEYGDGQIAYSSATLLTVASGAALGDIDASLEASGSIAGIVTRESDGAPLEGIHVRAGGVDAGGGGMAITGVDGSYEISGLAPQNYKVTFDGSITSTYVTEYWKGAQSWNDATLVPVRAGTSTGGIDASLAMAGSISGQIRFGGTPWSGMSVDIRLRTPGGSVVRNTSLSGHDVDGRYSVSDIPAGDYVVEARPSPRDGAASQYYRGAATGSEATLVSVRAGGATSDIDFDLVAGINIEGTLKAAGSGGSISGEVAAYRWDGSSWQEARRITSSGAYTFAGHVVSGGSSYLPAGTYTVGFEAEGYCTQYWNGVSSLDAATSLTPAVGSTQTGIDAALNKDCDNPAVTPGKPAIGGTATVGQTLTASPGTWSPDPVELSYQWLADGAPIAGATAQTLPLATSQEGKNITVAVTGSRPGYTSTSATSAPVGPVQGAPLKELHPGTPTIAGTPRLGEALTAAAGTWGPAPVSFGYQWLADGTPISGATSAQFVPAAEHVGKSVMVEVTGSRDGYAPASRTSADVVVAPGTLTVSDPVVGGTIGVGQELTVDVSAWGPAPLELVYQWLTDGAPIEGAAQATFTPDGSQVGATISVTVTGSRPGYTSETRSSVAGVVPPSLVVSETRAQRGQATTATGQFYAAGEEVVLELHSEPVELARVTADAEGRFVIEVTIPTDAELATHNVVGTGQKSGLIGTASVEVYDPSSTPTPAPSGSAAAGGSGGAAGAGALPNTGGTVPVAVLVIAFTMLVAGGLIVRRRRTMS